jgi:Na+/H+-dicarboxylate symporter/ABC-type amino acid transport substrate-binding protein
MSGSAASRPSPPRSLSSKVAIGLFAGGAVGLFVGEAASVLQLVADAYVKLLQMMVLPYVTVSIIGGLGTLNAAQAKNLAKRVGVAVLLFWALALALVLLFPLTFPSSENASFFSTTLLDEREPFDFVNLYVPANPFNALANNIVPAVVLFSVVTGVGLIAVPEKARLLEVLKVAASAVSRAMDFVIALMPYGVFAIAAVVAGTLSIDELRRLQVYLIAYTGMALLLSLWILPGLVAALSPVPYGVLLSRTRDALVLAFMTANLFAVLPLLTEHAKALVREYAHTEASATDVIVPASFNVPHSGKILSLSFLLFAGWFADTRVALADFPRLAGTGLITMFGNVNAAIPYLLDMLRIPADTFRLFVASAVINARFGTLVAAVHTLSLAILGTCAVTGTLSIRFSRLFRYAAVTVLLTALVVVSIRVLLQVVLVTPHDRPAVLSDMQMLRDRGPAVVLPSATDVRLPPLTGSVVDRVRQRGILRVGYFDDSLPYVYRSRAGELIGFDVEMAMQLAADMGATAEFVLLPRTALDSGVDPQACDIVMSGTAVTIDRSIRVQFSTSYVDETLAFLVPDHRIAAFSDWNRIRSMPRLRVGVPGGAYYTRKLRDELADVDVVPIGGIDEAFNALEGSVDAVLVTAERGSAFTLMHPKYSVAVPKPRPVKVPLAYAVAGRDAAMVSLVNSWIALKHDDGTVEQLFAHWIMGQTPSAKPPRWSVIRDVLHWVR